MKLYGGDIWNGNWKRRDYKFKRGYTYNMHDDIKQYKAWHGATPTAYTITLLLLLFLGWKTVR